MQYKKMIHALCVLTAVLGLLTHEVQTEDVCTNVDVGQLQCSDDCKEVLLCLTPGADPIIFDTCEEPFFCDSITHTCTAKQCTSPSKAFLCAGVGMLPSAYDCGVSYFCSGEGSKPDLECSCKSGYFYDVQSNGCKSVEESKCPRDSATCPDSGHNDHLDDGFCYVCNDKLDAIVYQCPPDANPLPNKLPTGATCVRYNDPSDEATSTTETSSSTSTETPDSTSTTSSSTPTEPTSTTSSSTSTESPDSTSTTSSSTSTETTESSTSSSTSTSSTESTSQTTSTSTSSSTDSTPTTTEAVPTDTPPARCSVEGQRFPVASNCRWFWLCVGRPPIPVLYKCNPNLYFDPVRLGCVTGNCTNLYEY